MSVSPKRQTRKSLTQTSGSKSARKNWMKRMLRLETLEQRQLMATDIMPFHNSLVPADVNGDFAITPLDALVVINKLNTQGSGTLAGKAAPTNRAELFDVDNDNSLSPLDALVVINALNNGEGVGELVEVRYKFFSVNADGTAGTELPDPTPNNGQPDAVIGTGDRVIVRTQIKDLRSPTPLGVFSAYHDLTFKNDDNAATEKLQLQWGEFNQLDIQNNVRGGTFTIRYGSETTAPIAVAFTNGIYSASGTSANIRNAIQALPSVGTGNVRVSSLTSTGTFRFGISFIQNLARVNFVNPVIGSNNLNDGAAGAVTLTILGQDNPDPADDTVARVARNHNLDNGTFEDNTGQQVAVTRYTNGPDGTLKVSGTDPSLRTMTLLGGFATSSDFLNSQVASSFLNVVDVLFKASTPGVIDFAGKTSPPPAPGQSGDNLGIALYGARAEYLTSAQVLLPKGSITIADRLTAVKDTASIAEDADTTNINVVANDIDRFGTSRSVTAVGAVTPANAGTVTFSGQNVSFKPSKDYNGPATFTYTIRNNVTPTPDTATGTVEITVTPVNDAPVALTGPFATPESTLLIIPKDNLFSKGPADESSQVITLSNVVTSAQTHGTVTIVDGNINYTPTAGYNGPAIFQVTGTDTGTATDPAKSTVGTFTVNVTEFNDAPTAFAGTIPIAEDGTLVLIGTGAPTDLLKRSSAGPGETTQVLRLISIQSPTPQGGTVTTVAGVTSYKPLANFFGTDTIVYTISDDGTPNKEATGTVTINVTAVNDDPVAVNDTGAARFTVAGVNNPTDLDVMRNDNAGPLEPADTITIKSVTVPSLGTATINAAKTRVVYTPPTGQFNTTATFSYTIEDAGGRTSTANVEVFIIPPDLPFATDKSATLAEGGSPITIDVLANNFVNAGGVARLNSFTAVSPASNGSIALDDRGTPADPTDDRIVYTLPASNPDFFGDFTFTYTIKDDANSTKVSNVATVVVSVTNVNDPPVATDQTAGATEDTVKNIVGSSITDALSRGPGEAAQTLTITNVSMITAGAGTVAIDAGNIVYTPAKDFNGQARVSYTVTDNGTPALSATATLTITVDPVNDAPVFGSDPTVVTPEDQAATISIDTLLSNDAPGPANESSQVLGFVGFAGTQPTANGGTVAIVGTNFVYTPAANYNGPDSFTYQISDGQSANATTTATLSFTVTEVNDVPTATSLSRQVFASVPTIFTLTGDLAGMPKGPANESGQTLRVTRVIPDGATKGTVTLNADGTITYTAPAGASGSDTFTYEVTDNGTTNGVADAKTATGTFTVNIAPFVPSSVRGVVFVDDNNNQTIDANELKMGGVDVTLNVAATATTPATTITKKSLADGSYAFDLLPPGAYTVSYTVPALMLDAAGPNSVNVNVVAPGNVNSVVNFAVLGVIPGYGNVLENLSSSYYGANGGLRTKGVYAMVDSTGKSGWTIARDGFEGDTFQEVVLSGDNQSAFLSAVRGADHKVFTATLARGQFVVVNGNAGNKLVRVIAESSGLNWTQVSLAAPPVTITNKAPRYLDAVDDVFAQQKW
jgi:large repetitive protein